MAEDNEQAPKIFIDDDWKEQARREKEEADREVRQAEEAGETGPLPGPHIAEIIQMVTMQATIGLGGFRDQNGQAIPPNLEYAKHYIDLLELLQNKTRNNLDDQEQRMLTGTLQELRLAFVEIYQAMSRQAAPPPPAKE
ncbi:MAG: DUF1844 domain-containing protein [Phycisphaerae bacterium]|nr:DUF1844 domain-containing protein [Phycisphaerae bacterium]